MMRLGLLLRQHFEYFGCCGESCKGLLVWSESLHCLSAQILHNTKTLTMESGSDVSVWNKFEA